MVDFYKRDGTIATKSEFLSENKRAGREIGSFDTVINSDNVNVNAYYAGINHGLDGAGKPKIYEVVVNGNSLNTQHDKYHGHHKTYHTSAEAKTEYDRVVAAIKAGGRL